MDHKISQATQGEAILLVDDVVVEFNSCYFPHNLVHATRFSGHDICVAEGGGKFNNYSAEIQNKTIISSTTMTRT